MRLSTGTGASIAIEVVYFAIVFACEFTNFANLSKKSRRVLDMAEQDVITPLASGGDAPAGFDRKA
ncbi:hypothetical protein [Neorhizobium sp. NCHU2750]|uniref:hypothetical protein n=1 Tax=Neorhizobium sp. NCHU2750 TaxID=1825976 RepID=UPI0013C47248